MPEVGNSFVGRGGGLGLQRWRTLALLNGKLMRIYVFRLISWFCAAQQQFAHHCRDET